MSRYQPATEYAKQIHNDLKARFPDFKFSVKQIFKMETLRVSSASWNGEEGATHFVFSDGSHGVQHFIGTGLGMRAGELHTLTPTQHIAVVKWIDRQNVGKGVL